MTRNKNFVQKAKNWFKYFKCDTQSEIQHSHGKIILILIRTFSNEIEIRKRRNNWNQFLVKSCGRKKINKLADSLFKEY